MNGYLLTFEGIDGSGKSTMAKKAFDYIADHPIQAILTSEPTSKFKELIVNTDLDPDAEALLFLADRAQHIKEVIKPALYANKVVIVDRFIDSTFAYQCMAGFCTLSSQIESIHKSLTLKPNLTIYLKIDEETSNARAKNRNKFEEKDSKYKQNVIKGYDLISSEPRVVTIDATLPEEEVWNQIKAIIDEKIINKYKK